ncbi:unnamed protein product [Cyprideis torosa]|uniref:Uncharacterized protein n=1 Tax=Cyprideis torosa TaxID=163714 RepID=A0A7R8WC66_9CRUS|nr:unnamed protein product [Cyprideis torosa]CAG0893100.1 unnamed protein product [Cyprideis torosa]
MDPSPNEDTARLPSGGSQISASQQVVKQSGTERSSNKTTDDLAETLWQETTAVHLRSCDSKEIQDHRPPLHIAHERYRYRPHAKEVNISKHTEAGIEISTQKHVRWSDAGFPNFMAYRERKPETLLHERPAQSILRSKCSNLQPNEGSIELESPGFNTTTKKNERHKYYLSQRNVVQSSQTPLQFSDSFKEEDLQDFPRGPSIEQQDSIKQQSKGCEVSPRRSPPYIKLRLQPGERQFATKIAENSRDDEDVAKPTMGPKPDCLWAKNKLPQLLKSVVPTPARGTQGFDILRNATEPRKVSQDKESVSCQYQTSGNREFSCKTLPCRISRERFFPKDYWMGQSLKKADQVQELKMIKEERPPKPHSTIQRTSTECRRHNENDEARVETGTSEETKPFLGKQTSSTCCSCISEPQYSNISNCIQPVTLAAQGNCPDMSFVCVRDRSYRPLSPFDPQVKFTCQPRQRYSSQLPRYPPVSDDKEVQTGIQQCSCTCQTCRNSLRVRSVTRSSTACQTTSQLSLRKPAMSTVGTSTTCDYTTRSSPPQKWTNLLTSDSRVSVATGTSPCPSGRLCLPSPGLKAMCRALQQCGSQSSQTYYDSNCDVDQPNPCGQQSANLCTPTTTTYCCHPASQFAKPQRSSSLLQLLLNLLPGSGSRTYCTTVSTSTTGLLCPNDVGGIDPSTQNVIRVRPAAVYPGKKPNCGTAQSRDDRRIFIEGQLECPGTPATSVSGKFNRSVSTSPIHDLRSPQPRRQRANQTTSPDDFLECADHKGRESSRWFWPFGRGGSEAGLSLGQSQSMYNIPLRDPMQNVGFSYERRIENLKIPPEEISLAMRGKSLSSSAILVSFASNSAVKNRTGTTVAAFNSFTRHTQRPDYRGRVQASAAECQTALTPRVVKELELEKLSPSSLTALLHYIQTKSKRHVDQPQTMDTKLFECSSASENPVLTLSVGSKEKPDPKIQLFAFNVKKRSIQQSQDVTTENGSQDILCKELSLSNDNVTTVLKAKKKQCKRCGKRDSSKTSKGKRRARSRDCVSVFWQRPTPLPNDEGGTTNQFNGRTASGGSSEESNTNRTPLMRKGRICVGYDVETEPPSERDRERRHRRSSGHKVTFTPIPVRQDRDDEHYRLHRSRSDTSPRRYSHRERSPGAQRVPSDHAVRSGQAKMDIVTETPDPTLLPKEARSMGKRGSVSPGSLPAQQNPLSMYHYTACPCGCVPKDGLCPPHCQPMPHMPLCPPGCRPKSKPCPEGCEECEEETTSCCGSSTKSGKPKCPPYDHQHMMQYPYNCNSMPPVVGGVPSTPVPVGCQPLLRPPDSQSQGSTNVQVQPVMCQPRYIQPVICLPPKKKGPPSGGLAACCGAQSDEVEWEGAVQSSDRTEIYDRALSINACCEDYCAREVQQGKKDGAFPPSRCGPDPYWVRKYWLDSYPRREGMIPGCQSASAFQPFLRPEDELLYRQQQLACLGSGVTPPMYSSPLSPSSRMISSASNIPFQPNCVGLDTRATLLNSADWPKRSYDLNFGLDCTSGSLPSPRQLYSVPMESDLLEAEIRMQCRALCQEIRSMCQTTPTPLASLMNLDDCGQRRSDSQVVCTPQADGSVRCCCVSGARCQCGNVGGIATPNIRTSQSRTECRTCSRRSLLGNNISSTKCNVDVQCDIPLQTLTVTPRPSSCTTIPGISSFLRSSSPCTAPSVFPSTIPPPPSPYRTGYPLCPPNTIGPSRVPNTTCTTSTQCVSTSTGMNRGIDIGTQDSCENGTIDYGSCVGGPDRMLLELKMPTSRSYRYRDLLNMNRVACVGGANKEETIFEFKTKKSRHRETFKKGNTSLNTASDLSPLSVSEYQEETLHTLLPPPDRRASEALRLKPEKGSINVSKQATSDNSRQRGGGIDDSIKTEKNGRRARHGITLSNTRHSSMFLIRNEGTRSSSWLQSPRSRMLRRDTSKDGGGDSVYPLRCHHLLPDKKCTVRSFRINRFRDCSRSLLKSTTRVENFKRSVGSRSKSSVRGETYGARSNCFAKVSKFHHMLRFQSQSPPAQATLSPKFMMTPESTNIQKPTICSKKLTSAIRSGRVLCSSCNGYQTTTARPTGALECPFCPSGPDHSSNDHAGNVSTGPFGKVDERLKQLLDKLEFRNMVLQQSSSNGRTRVLSSSPITLESTDDDCALRGGFCQMLVLR